MHPDKQHPRHDQNPDTTLSDTHTKTADAELSSHHVPRGLNMFRHIPCIVSDLPMPDLHLKMQIGMLDHLQKWIVHFMKTHERLAKYNEICLSVPAYHDRTTKNDS